MTKSIIKPREVFVVFKTHYDIGFTDLASEVVNRYRTSMIDEALAVCDQSGDLPPEHRFVWTMPGWPMAQVLWDGQSPQRRKRILEAFKNGRFVIHALPFTTHTEFLELEDLVRGMGFSSRLARSAGLELPRDAKMTDVPSHSWVLPTLLKNAGVDFLHLGCNPVSASPEVPMLFWWEGPDGSRLLTMYSATNYGSGLIPPKNWPYATWLAMIQTNDNVGPPDMSEVRKLLDEAKHELPAVKVRMGRLSDFADAILKENPELPVVRADMPDTWIHGTMSMPVETKIARHVRLDIGVLDVLNTLVTFWKLDVPAAKETVAAAYEKSLMYGEHTWGLNRFKAPFCGLYGKQWEDARAKGHYERFEESDREQGAYIHEVDKLVTPALAANMEALAQAVKVDGPRLVVYNPLPWSRSGIISVEAPPKIASGLKEVSAGKVVATEREGRMIRFVASDIPPMGYRTYVPATAQAAGNDIVIDETTATVENSYFRLRFAPSRGVVTSLIDKRSGCELADSESKYGLGQYLYERFDADINEAYLAAYCKIRPDWHAVHGKVGLPPAAEIPYCAASPKDFKMNIRRGQISATVTMTAAASNKMPHAVTLKVMLFHNQPFVDFEWVVTNKKPDPWPEAGWLCFPLKIAQPLFRLGRLGAVIDPARDIVPSSNHDIFCLNSGMTVTGPDQRGVGLCPVDSPLVSLGYPGIFRYTRKFAPRKPVVFVHLFNNIWGCNFPQWIGGSWSSRVRMWALDNHDTEAGLVTPSQQVRSPLRATVFDGPAGMLPASQSGMELSRKGVLVTALGPNPDGEGLVLRLWEQAGRDGICRVRLPEQLHLKRVQPCDLRGQPIGKPIKVRNGWFEVWLTHFAPVSLLLEQKG